MTNIKPGDPIQPALNAGDIKLLKGLHPNVGTLTSPNGRVIANETGAILQRPYFNLVNAQNIRFPDGLELDGSGDARTAMTLEKAKGVQIDGLFVHHFGEGIYVNYCEDCWVRQSRFEQVGGQASNTAIFGFEPRRSDFSHSKYIDCGEGIHFFFKLFQYGDKRVDKTIRNDVTINYNEFHNVRRHPIELQEGVRGLEVRGNWIGHWTSAIKSIIGISAALGGDPSNPGPDAWEIHVWENVIDGAGLVVVDTSQFMGVEVMGDTFTADRNEINNMGQPFAVTYNSAKTRIENNNVRGTVRPPQGWWRDNKGIIVADQPADRYVPVVDIGNRWSTDPMPGPPVDGGGSSPVITNIKATEANPPVVTWTGGATRVTRTDQHGQIDKKPDGSLAVFPSAASPFTDNFIPVDHFENTWHVQYVVGDAAPVQIQLPKPTTPPPGSGFIVTNETEIDEKGKVLSSKSTTKPRTVAP